VAAGGLEVDVVKAVRVPVPASFVRTVLVRAASIPESRRDCRKAQPRSGRPNRRQRAPSTQPRLRGEDSVTDFCRSRHRSHVATCNLVPTAVRQSRAFVHEPHTELALLAVHGCCTCSAGPRNHVGAKRDDRLTRAALNWRA